MGAMNVALIGPRGAGKTRVGIHLARLLKWPLMSTDALVSYEAGGKSIRAIVEAPDQGWREFRRREFAVLQKVTAMDGVILDCGGGIVVDLDDAGREVLSERKVGLLRERALVFFLKPPLQQVVAKIAGDAERPSLGDEQTAEEIYRRRLPWYRQACHHELAIIKGQRRKAAEQIASISGAATPA